LTNTDIALMVEQLGLPVVSRLERLIAQAAVVKREMVKSNVSGTAFSTFELLISPGESDSSHAEANGDAAPLSKARGVDATLV
jgi:hypothetical protein